MALRVLVERRARTGCETMVWQMIREMRAEALRTRGYLYGETWRSKENPRVFMVVSVWASIEHWRSWAQSDYRLKMEERISRMLQRPSVPRLFEDSSEPVIVSMPKPAMANQKRLSKKVS